MTQAPKRPPQPDAFDSINEYILAHERYCDAQRPTPEETLNRAARLADQAMRAIDMQIRRLNEAEPEDDEWILRPLMDSQFLVTALWHLRLSALAAMSVDSVREVIEAALSTFDDAIPGLSRIRNVYQHIDDYVTDHPTKRRQSLVPGGPPISRRLTEIDAWSNQGFFWLRVEIRYDKARQASWDLLRVIRSARNQLREAAQAAEWGIASDPEL